MANKTYRLKFKLDNNTEIDAGTFVALQGEKGNTGATGDKGATGAKGDQGAKGNAGTATYYANVAISSSTTTVAKSSITVGSGRALQVDDLLVGNNGGVCKVTSVTNATDASVSYLYSIKGATGAKGDKGATGDKGETGATGDKGATGARGVSVTGATLTEVTA